jgi:hypothetical protein
MGYNPFNAGQYNAIAPNLTDGETEIVQLDNRGRQRIVLMSVGTLTTGQIAPGTTATSIIGVNLNRIRIVLTQMSTTPVFIGASGVTSSTGDYIPGIVGYMKVIRSSAALFGVVASGTGSISFAEESQ